MARLVLGVAGAVVGSFFGAPQIGFMIGSAIGGVVDPEVIKQEGPRMNDLKFQVSTWGNAIPIYYGSMRGAGNVIWSTPIRETKTVTEESGKGGPTVETTTYTYACDIAIGICEGEIAGIQKIWADGRLIYNVGTDADVETLVASGGMGDGFRVYSGSQTQMPDPTIEADKGAGNVSAYRGLAYVVFENFQLANYGNRIPNFEFKVLANVTESLSSTTASVPLTTWTDVAWSGDIVCGISSGYSIASFDIGESWTSHAMPSGTWAALAWNGSVFCAVSSSGSSDNVALSTDGKSWDTYTMPSANWTAMAWNGTAFCAIATSGDEVAVSYDGQLWSEYKLPQSTTWTAIAWNGTVFCAVASGGTVAATSPDGITWTARTLPASEFWTGIAWNGSTFCAVAQGTTTVALSEDGITWTTATISNSHAWNAIAWNGEMFCAVAEAVSGNGKCATSRDGTTWTGRNISNENWRSITAAGLAFVALCPGDISVTLAPRMASSDVDLSDIVSDQCTRSGLSASDIDVTALTDSVHGYAITRQATARQNLDQLQKAYYFDAVESDNKLKFVKRGGSVAVAISEDDLAAHEAGQAAPDALSIRRLQEVDLPARVTVNFPNLDGDYQVGSEKSERLVTSSKQQVGVDLAIAIDADKGAQIADVLLFDAYASRTPIRFSTSKKYAKYQPTDVVTVTDATASYRVRIVKKDESGPLINWESVTDDSTIYTSTVTGGSIGQTQTQVTTPGPTRVEFLDIPIVRDQDSDAGMYVAMAGYKDSWRGAILYSSSDGIVYADAATVENSATIGACDTTLGTWAGGNFFDEKNTLDVTLTSGTLSSATNDQVLAGANAALVGSEIIQFKTATLIDTNQYRLSGLLRGRRGTEQHYSTHTSNELFVLLTVAGIARPNEGASSIGETRYYQAVSFGRNRAQSAVTTATNNAVGLKPLAPVHFSGGKQTNDDFIIGWTRRTRIDGGWRDYVDAALGEASQSYEVDVMDGATVVRTLTSSTATVTYTAAMGTTDFGAPPANLTVKIYQMSETVGRGFPGTHTY